MRQDIHFNNNKIESQVVRKYYRIINFNSELKIHFEHLFSCYLCLICLSIGLLIEQIDNTIFIYFITDCCFFNLSALNLPSYPISYTCVIMEVLVSYCIITVPKTKDEIFQDFPNLETAVKFYRNA